MCVFRARRVTMYLSVALLTLGVGSGWFGDLSAARAADVSVIQHIDLVHLSHTDVGFTDHPMICRELQCRYLDIAIDAVLATRDRPESARFCWTTESTIGVDDWWRSATPERRADFLKAVDSGQLAVAAVAMNNTAFLNGPEWHKMLHWLPEDLWRRVHPTVAMQDDVNGIPRAGAMAMLDRGVHRLLTGMNVPAFLPPLVRPSAIWWKMPDGRRLFVYLGYCYPSGIFFFDPVEWRHGPVPRAGDTRYRPPRAGDFLGSDEASVSKAHRHLLGRLHGLEAEGYRYPTLLLPITNQWRMDNDPPMPALADFVATWHRLELKPTLRLTTAAVAMKRMEEEVGDRATEYQGEWPDWWSFGTASAPREVAASRVAKRLLAAAGSPLWGPWTAGGRRAVDQSLRDLCLFDEHTWGSADSVALPYSLDTQGQFNEKAALAFRPMVRAEWLLGQRVRSRLINEGEGLFLANSAPLPWSGWIRMRCSAFREDDLSVEDAHSGGKAKMYFERGFAQFQAPRDASELSRGNPDVPFADNAPRQIVKFWADKLPGNSIRKLKPSTKDVGDDRSPPGPPKITADAQGWPTAIVWPGMTKPLCLPGLGDFVAVRAKGFAPRSTAGFWSTADAARREKLRREVFEATNATANEKAKVEDNPHTLVFTQFIEHPRLKWATRQLEVWKCEPRAKFTLRLDRTSSLAPETFYVVFPFPCESAWPETSCGNMPFVPIRDQLPGTCRDFYGIDGWVHYATPEGHWLWVSRDAPLVSFGGPRQMLPALGDRPEGMNRVLAMIFDNFWETNFVGDSHGVMEFCFDLAWRKELPASIRVADVARTLASEPQVMISPGLKENPIIVKRLFTP